MIITAQDFVVRRSNRRGTILSLLAVTIVGLVSFLALAIDLGMLAIAKTQAQNAADLAALTAARTVNGNPTGTYNQAGATTNAQNLLTFNYILGQSIQSSQLTLTYGSYDYDQSKQTFSANFPATAGVPTTAVAATVTSNSLPGAFSKIFGSQFLPNVSATAQAVHRPRDIGLAMDLSGSMRFGTCLGFDFYTSSRTTNNPDTVVPAFGHYSSASANLTGTSSNRTSAISNYTMSPSNTTAANTSYTRTYINNFYSNAAYASPLIRAFDSYTSTDGGNTWAAPTSGAPVLPPASYTSVPGGDVPLFFKGSTTNYAQEVEDAVGSTTRNASWELDGYSNYTNGSLVTANTTGKHDYSSGPFNGYTQGPGYYGKTFFIWPPDPRRPLNTGTTTAWSSTTSDMTTIKQFLMDFGYPSTDFSNGTSGPPLNGIFSSGAWPWPSGDDGTGSKAGTISYYLINNVYKPSSTTAKLAITDPAFQQIMRLYSWNNVIGDNLNTPCDWRIRFFGTNNNTVLFNSSGSLNPPGSSGMKMTAVQTYNEILRWIAQSPNPFPTMLRAGRVKYYGAIPYPTATANANGNWPPNYTGGITGSYPNWGGTDQRFWVECINYMLGFYQTGASSYQNVSAMAGYGSDFTWGTVQRNSPPASVAAPSNSNQYMNYTDIPLRPRLRHWFSPISMVDYLQNYNMDSNVSNYFYMQPGDSYEAPLYTGKEGFQAAISTMQNDHPNDWFTLALYSWPRSSNYGIGLGRFNNVSCPLGTNYAYASSALYFPFSTINADGTPNNTEITPYDADPATSSIPSANFVDTPRADGDTCFAMGLMLCYNQFAVTQVTDTTLRSFVTNTPITFPTGMAGGMGRKGAQKVIIFETDGLANCSATANLVNSGTYNYYQIRYDMNNPTSGEYPSINPVNINDPTVLAQVYSIVDQLKSDYGTTRNPFRLYAMGFGPVFSGPDATNAETTLQTMQYHAGTQAAIATPLPSNQIITGTDAVMSANMVAAFTSILQNGVQIALIK